VAINTDPKLAELFRLSVADIKACLRAKKVNITISELTLQA